MAMSEQLTSSRFPFLPIRLEVRQETYEDEALLDTGFDGGMAVPPFLLAGQAPDWYQLWTLADGSHVTTPVYRGVVGLGNFQPITILVVALGDEWIIGLGILNHFSITFDHGKKVMVRP